MKEFIWGISFIASGIFLLATSIFNDDWFSKSGGLRKIEKKFGRSGVRVVLSLLGVLLIASGIVQLVTKL